MSVSALHEVESVILRNLKPSTQYGVLVQAKTNGGIGPPSTAPLCSTLDEGRLENIKGLKMMKVINSNSNFMYFVTFQVHETTTMTSTSFTTSAQIWIHHTNLTSSTYFWADGNRIFS